VKEELSTVFAFDEAKLRFGIESNNHAAHYLAPCSPLDAHPAASLR
jgi:hypothetical protein